MYIITLSNPRSAARHGVQARSGMALHLQQRNALIYRNLAVSSFQQIVRARE